MYGLRKWEIICVTRLFIHGNILKTIELNITKISTPWSNLTYYECFRTIHLYIADFLKIKLEKMNWINKRPKLKSVLGAQTVWYSVTISSIRINEKWKLAFAANC